eukprot:504575-Prymnesium_polylepis.1
MRSRVGRAERAAAHRAGVAPATTRVWRCAVPPLSKTEGRPAAFGRHISEPKGRRALGKDHVSRAAACWWPMAYGAP